ncbi:MAG: zinc ribbon domain-containing protein [Candidatus Margulisbacteria bacterium]|jgi:hypothetical protein|nr:zinc ribbon domain-containing protein [Candidatus Margulisiibacteriota bacterium]
MENKRKCPACRKLINAGAKFCNFCGQPQTAAAPVLELTAKKFLSVRELETLKNELPAQEQSTLLSLCTHPNKYLARLALAIFLQQTAPAEAARLLQEYISDPDFLANLLEVQAGDAALFAALWPPVSASPWLVHKYLAWAKNKNYPLEPDAARYLAAAQDEYLQRAYR